MKEERLRAYVEQSDLAVPDDMLAQAIEQMTAERFHHKRYEYLVEGRFLTPDEVAEIAAEVRIEAPLALKTQLVLEEVVRQEAFEVTQEELEGEALALAERQQTTLEMVKSFFGSELLGLRDDLLMRKAIDFITD